MHRLLLILLLILGAGCTTQTVKLTDKYERGATLIIPTHVKALEVNGRVVNSSMLSDGLTLEIPAGRTEFVYKFVNIFDSQYSDDHEEVSSSKMTVVFNAKEGNNYKLICQNPDSLEEAQKIIGNIKSYLIHIESGLKTQSVKGEIEERFHGIRVMEPYSELKHWWKKRLKRKKITS